MENELLKRGDLNSMYNFLNGHKRTKMKLK